MQHNSRFHRSFIRIATSLLFTAVSLAAVLAGCGGGGVGTGGTGTYAAGPITGFGSIIVNDVRFDDSSASVIDDDDGVRNRSELKLGMTVAIDSDAIRGDATGRAATASRIRLGSEIVAPVTSVDPVAGTLNMLGQVVRITPQTVMDERLAGGLVAIRVGQLLEVYGQYDAANGRYNATRIEPRLALATWHLRGPITALDTARTSLRIGSTSFSYAAAAGVPADLAVGRFVRVRVDRVAGPFGGYVVTAFRIGVRTPEDRDEAELKGLITDFASAANFSVNGLSVDASSASFPDGSSGLGLGARVEARGTVRGGVLRATRVSIETDDEALARGFELKGLITSVDAAARTLTLRGETVSWARADLQLDDGTLADIKVDRDVEVRAQLSADRTRLEATRIKFK